jgi:hypothetical protein
LGVLRTIAEVPIVDPGVFYEVDLFVHSSIREFLHSLGQERMLARCHEPALERCSSNVRFLYRVLEPPHSRRIAMATKKSKIAVPFS